MIGGISELWSAGRTGLKNSSLKMQKMSEPVKASKTNLIFKGSLRSDGLNMTSLDLEVIEQAKRSFLLLMVLITQHHYCFRVGTLITKKE